MKKLLLIFLCCCAKLCFAQKDLGKKEKKLLKQEKKLAREMFDLRVKLLQKDLHLKKIYDKIMELHKELALMLDNKKEMRVLADKLKKVQKSLAAVQAKIKEEEGEEEEE